MTTISKIGIDQKSAVIELLLDIFSGEPWNDDWTNEQIDYYVEELMGNKNSLSFGLFNWRALLLAELRAGIREKNFVLKNSA